MQALIGVSILIGFVLLYNISIFYGYKDLFYTLFHTISELFSIIVAISIFIIAWNTRRFSDNSFFLFIGISFLFVAFLEIIHTLAYRGLNVFPGYTDIAAATDLAAKFWISARSAQGLLFLFSILFINKKRMKISLLFSGYSVIVIFLVWSIFANIFPTCFLAVTGLTPFKIISEYIIICILGVTIIFFYRNRKEFDRNILNLIILAIILNIFQELAFTLYTDAYGILNFLGHVLMMFSFYYIYKALIHTTLFRPYDLLFRDVKKSEEKLLIERNTLITLNKQIEAIIETVPDAILLLNTEGRVYLTNYQFQELYKQTYHADFSIGKILLDLPENYLINTIKEFFISGMHLPKIFQSEIGNYYQISSASIRLSDETIFGVLIVIHDVTEFIEIENLRKQILSNVSHELRTPLTVINLSIKNLENYAQRLSDEQKESIIRMISKNSILLSDMIEDLLTSSSIEAKTFRLQWAEYGLLALFQELLIQLEPPRLEKQINILLEIDQPIQLFGDSKRISQVFRILVDNAIKYSPDNSVIKIKAIDHYTGLFNPNQIDGVLIQVSDSGLGIKERDLPHLFKRFFRSDDVKAIRGTGLGLSIAKEIVQLHKGDIYVESEYGKGSTFSVFLPEIKNLDQDV